MKHRTQLLLDRVQFDFLKSLSRVEGESLSALIRRFVDEKREALGRPAGTDPLAKLFGKFRDKACTSENYEDFLYGKGDS